MAFVSFLIGVRPLLAVDDLASIRAQYDAAVSSLDSFEIQYTMIQRRKQAPSNEPAQRTSKMLWSESGPNNKLLAIGDAEGADWNRWRSVFSFDGTQGYNGSCHEDDLNRVGSIHMTDGISSVYYQLAIPAQFMGRIMPGQRQSLSELLDRSTARVIGREMVGGADCVRVGVVCDPPVSSLPPIPYDVWFDASASGLPRQFAYLVGSRKMKHTIDQFDRHRHPTLNQPVTLPSRMTWREPEADVEFTIDSVVLAAVPKNRFTIQPQNGTEVQEQFAGKRPRVYTVGQPAMLNQSAISTPENISQTTQPGHPAPPAIQDNYDTISRAFVWIGIAFVGVVVLVLIRRRSW